MISASLQFFNATPPKAEETTELLVRPSYVELILIWNLNSFLVHKISAKEYIGKLFCSLALSR